MIPSPSTRRRRARSHSVEILEARIAPATFVSLNSSTHLLLVQGDYVDDGSSTVQAGASETLSFSVSAGNLLINDPTHHVTASGPGVTQLGTGLVSIPVASLTGDYAIETGVGGDTLTFTNSLALATDRNVVSHTSGTITFAPGSSLSTTGAGSINLIASKNLVLNAGSVLSTVDGGIMLQGNPANVPQGAAFGIDVNGASITTTGGGKISLSGFGLLGVELRGNAVLGSSGSGTIGVMGTAEGGSFQHGVEIAGAGTRITSAFGAISVQGQGGSGQSGNVGVFVHTGAVVSSTGTAKITFTGIGGTGTEFNYGVALEDTGTLVTSLQGDVLINGVGGAGTLSTNAGISIKRGAQVTSTGLAKLILSGTGGSGTDQNYGLVIGDDGIASAGLASVDGDITLIGHAIDASGALQDGIRFEGSTAALQGFVTTSGSAHVALDGIAGNASAFGIDLTGFSTLAFHGAANALIADSTNLDNLATIAAAGKTVTLRGKAVGVAIDLGGTDASGKLGLTDAELDRITAGTLQIGDATSGAIAVSARISSANNLSLTTGAGVTFDETMTLAMDKSLTVSALGTIFLASANADLSATGTGAISLTTARNVTMVPGSSISTVEGNLDVSANQQVTSTSGDFVGIDMNEAAIQASGAGAVTVRGKGGDDAGGQQIGVRLRFGGIISGGTSGLLTVDGTGSNAGGGLNFGVVVSDANASLAPATITSVGADVHVTGVGGYGVMAISSGLITSGGAVTVMGTGSGDGGLGVYVAISGSITSNGTGAVSVTGTAGPGNGTVGLNVSNGGRITSSGGAITVTGSAADGQPAVVIETSGKIVSGNNAPVTIVADSLKLLTGGNVSSGAGTTTIQPRTPGTLIDLGDSDVLSGSPLTLGITEAELDQISAGTLHIGNAASGPIRISAVLSPAHLDVLELIGNTSFTAAGGLSLLISSATSFQKVKVTGTITIDPAAALAVSVGAYTPVATDTFVLLENNGPSAVIGTFAGKTEGDLVSLNGVSKRITYRGGGGVGNDVALAPLLSNTLAATLTGGKLTITDTDNSGKDNQLNVSVSGPNLIVTDSVEGFIAAVPGATLSNGNKTLTIPLSLLTSGLTLATAGGNDTVTLDLSGGNPFPGGSIIFAGGAGSADSLIIMGGAQSTVVYDYTNASDGHVAMSAFGTVTFTGLEAIANSGMAATTVFNLPAGPNAATLADDGTPGNSLSRLSGGTIARTDFWTLSGELTINRGNAGDILTIGARPDFGASLAVGSPASPFGGVAFTGSVAVESPLDIAANNFSVGTGLTVIGTGTLTIGAGTVSGHLGGTLGITKVGPGALSLATGNTYKGETMIQGGTVTLADANAAQNSNVRLAIDNGLHFASGLGTFLVGGLVGVNKLLLADDASAAVTLRVGHNDSDTTYTGVLSGPGDLVKVGVGTLTLTAASDHHATFIENGILQVSRDAALGRTGNVLTFRGGTLHATATFSTARPIFLESGTGTFEASLAKTLTLGGVISGPGSLALGPVGKVAITNVKNTNSGTTQLDSDNNTVVNGVTISTPRVTGVVIVTPGPTPNSIAKIDITGTNTKTTLTINGPKNTPVTVAQIVSNDLTEITAITLGKNVTLGNGVADAIPDLVVAGKVGRVTLTDVSANTIIQLGKGLAYLDTYKNRPVLTMNNVGDGVVIEVTGNGLPGATGFGGGGLGAVTVNSWTGTGTIKTSQSITSFTVKKGNFTGLVQVDPGHLGEATVGSIGKVSIPNGSWGGAGMQVEGLVASFLTKGLIDGTTISAGSFGPVTIKGNYAGNIIATYDPAVAVPVKNKPPKIIATGVIGNITIAGDFTGLINGDGKVGNVTLSGSARFQGTLRGASLGNITAASFTGGLATDGVRKTITAIGSIGNITAKTGGLTDYLIAAGTNLGSDALAGGVADTFASYYLTTTNVKTAVSIGAVTIKGAVTGTTIAAGVDPGLDGIYGDVNDLRIALPVEVTRTKVKIGALKFDSAFPTLAFTETSALPVTNAFEAANLTSVQLGAVKVTKFDVLRYIDSGAASIIVRLLT